MIKVKPEYQFTVKSEDKVNIINLLKKCDIETFWHVKINKDILFCIEGDHDKIEHFIEERKQI